MKEVRIIMNVVMEVAKVIEEKVILIHQTMKEQAKTFILQAGVEDDITQCKMKGEGMVNPTFNVIIVTNIVIVLMNVEVPLTI